MREEAELRRQREKPRGGCEDRARSLLTPRQGPPLPRQRAEKLMKEGARRSERAEPCHGSQLIETQGTVSWRAPCARPESSFPHSPLKKWGDRGWLCVLSVRSVPGTPFPGHQVLSPFSYGGIHSCSLLAVVTATVQFQCLRSERVSEGLLLRPAFSSPSAGFS